MKIYVRGNMTHAAAESVKYFVRLFSQCSGKTELAKALAHFLFRVGCVSFFGPLGCVKSARLGLGVYSRDAHLVPRLQSDWCRPKIVNSTRPQSKYF